MELGDDNMQPSEYIFRFHNWDMGTNISSYVSFGSQNITYINGNSNDGHSSDSVNKFE
jgi:hypothetical protein